MKKRFYTLFLAFVYLVTTSCAHHETVETRTIALPEYSGGERQIGDLKVQSLIYRESELPLQEFFRNLMQGKYKKAIKRIYLDYKPSNNSNEAVAELIGSGFIPVYVSVTNTGTAPITLSEKNFTLVGEDGRRIPALVPNGLPHDFEHTDSEAVTGNIAKTAAIVILVVVIIAVLAAAAKHSGGTPHYYGGFQSSAPPPKQTESAPFYSETTRVTHVNYKNYLVDETVLAPGESMRGLVFFYRENLPANMDDKVEFTLSPVLP